MTVSRTRADDPRPLAGRRALIFGGTRGIGEAIVRRLAAEGVAVAFTYTRSEEKAQALVTGLAEDGVRILAIRADSAQAEQVRSAVERASAQLDGLDIVVANAGILKRGPVDTFSVAEFDQLMAINVRGVFAAVHYAAPHLTHGGRIITIGSVTAERSVFPGVSAYAASKAAVAALVRSAAIDLAPRGITVNNIQPGSTNTDLTAGGTEHLLSLIPLRRIGEPGEIAGLVVYLASAEAAFITGTSLTIDGGYLA